MLVATPVTHILALRLGTHAGLEGILFGSPLACLKSDGMMWGQVSISVVVALPGTATGSHRHKETCANGVRAWRAGPGSFEDQGRRSMEQEPLYLFSSRPLSLFLPPHGSPCRLGVMTAIMVADLEPSC